MWPHGMAVSARRRGTASTSIFRGIHPNGFVATRSGCRRADARRRRDYPLPPDAWRTYKVDAGDAGQWQEDCDALITDTVDLPLMLVFADCTPLVLYDPIHHAVGVCHAGWRGTVNGVATATLWAMQAAYGADPADVRVGIGPGIGPASYPVGAEVVDLAHAKLPAAANLFSHPNGATQPHFNLWQANAQQLADAGVPVGRTRSAHRYSRAYERFLSPPPNSGVGCWHGTAGRAVLNHDLTDRACFYPEEVLCLLD